MDGDGGLAPYFFMPSKVSMHCSTVPLGSKAAANQLNPQQAPGFTGPPSSRLPSKTVHPN
ncbi:hypothetical protein DSO57_1017487 [Entomophthora muscae]|nr:hypothetical protein DSO57_1017487 [Entomophthora muscae]